MVTHLVCIPYTCVEACGTSVKGVRAVVDGQLVFLAVELELTFLDAVAKTADQRGKIRLRRIDDFLDIVVTLNHIGYVAVFVGNHNGDNGASIVRNSHFIA